MNEKYAFVKSFYLEINEMLKDFKRFVQISNSLCAALKWNWIIIITLVDGKASRYAGIVDALLFKRI